MKTFQLKGVYGGTFNPIHHGHLRMAQEVAEQLAFAEVKFIPSANPPHKVLPRVSADHRAEMVKLAIQDNDLFSLDTRELERDRPSYTIDTIQSLYKEESDSALCLMLGSDAFMQFDTWHQWDKIIDYCHIILVHRPDSGNKTGLNSNLEAFMRDYYTQQPDDLATAKQGFITMQPITALDISSTKIRQTLKQDFDIRYLTPKAVADYINQHQLYTAN